MTERRGFVLLVVMLLMALGSALMIGALDGSSTEGDTARIGTLQRQALVGAESEAWTVLTSAVVPGLRQAPVGPVSISNRSVGDVALIATVDKVDTSLVWIVATASIHRGGYVARHRIGITALIPHDTADLTLHPVPERAWVELF